MYVDVMRIEGKSENRKYESHKAITSANIVDVIKAAGRCFVRIIRAAANQVIANKIDKMGKLVCRMCDFAKQNR